MLKYIKEGEFYEKHEQNDERMYDTYVMMHSLFGLGLGLVVAAIVPGLASILLGAIVMVVAIGLDMMRK